MNQRPIGVFDSGVGGLTVVKELMRCMPHENIVYFGDTGRVPYGTRSRNTIQKYASQDIRFLLSHNVKMIIAACGTVSSTISDQVVEQLPVPFTGVVKPTAQKACALSLSGRIGVIGTTATVRSGAFGRAIRGVRSDAVVIGNACPLFVPLVENGFIQQDNPVTRMVAQQYLKPIQEEKVDTLILGCTHYPLLFNMINELLDYQVTLVDAGKATAEYACNYLTEHAMLNDSQQEGPRKFFVSDQPESFMSVAEMFLGIPAPEAVHVDLDLLE